MQMAADGTSNVHLNLDEAQSMYQHHIIRTKYKGSTIIHCTAIFLGKGSFGKVYKGWKEDGRQQIAVKIIEQSFLDQQYNARENLDREIKIMRLMQGCDNVVQIFEALKIEEDVMITMEMCDGDLQKLLKMKKSFKEKEVVDFLHQLGEGMKELRKRNIVHRDIKPENILIKHRQQSIVYKLADFGYARHFDCNRPKMMESIVGTPIYMAPEALIGYLHHQEVHYNDKADVWSIGALLYKVLVGKDAFPATHRLHDYLKLKKDSIAYELRSKHGPTYIDELPAEVQKKLSPVFCLAITELLVGMLKFEPTERFSFPTFFKRIDDIIESRLELINILHGTSIKLIPDSDLIAQVLVMKASCTWNIPQEQVVIFSPVHPKYIGAHQQITKEEFESLVEKSGGQDGHAKLYVLTLEHLSADVEVVPDMSCFQPLWSALEERKIEHRIRNLRFMDEIFYMIHCMEKQLHNQLESVEKLYQFAINETGMSTSYNNLKKKVQQMLARISLMLEILGKDLEWCGDENDNTLLLDLIHELATKEQQLKGLEMEFEIKIISLPEKPFHWKECRKNIQTVFEKARNTTKSGNIPNNCNQIFDYCLKMITMKTTQTKLKLAAYGEVLKSTWSLYSKSAIIEEITELLARMQSERQKLFEDCLRPPSDRVESFPSINSMRDYTSKLQELRHGKDKLQRQLTVEVTSHAETKKQYNDLVTSCKKSELAVKEKDMAEDERTNSIVAVERLNEQLQEFCTIGSQVLCVSRSVESQSERHSAHRRGKSVVDEELLVKAKDLATQICTSISFVGKGGMEASQASLDTVVKITYPENYKAGDIVLLTPVNTLKGSVPSIFHLNWKKPHMLMDFTCLKPMGIKAGKVPQLFLGKLRDTPLKLNLEDYTTTAQDLGQNKGIFYRASIDPVPLKFSEKDVTLLCQEEQQHSVSFSKQRKSFT